MAVTFNELLEGTELSEEVRGSIQEAWNSKLSEAKEQLTAELREEFAQRYEHDKSLIVEAMDNFITTKVTAEVEELADDRKALAESFGQYDALNIDALEAFLETQDLSIDKTS